MKLLIVPLMVRVSALVHRVILFIGNLLTLLKFPSMPCLEVAVITKQDTVTERIRAFVLSWFPMMWLPSPACAFSAVFPNKSFTASTARSSLSVPSLLYSVAGKSHSTTSRRVSNGWVSKGKSNYALFQNGKSTGMTIAALPFLYHGKSKQPVYDIYHGNKYIGYTRSLVAAKRRAETYFKKMR